MAEIGPVDLSGEQADTVIKALSMAGRMLELTSACLEQHHPEGFFPEDCPVCKEWIVTMQTALDHWDRLQVDLERVWGI